MKGLLTVIKSDITQQDVDAIVNAANATLLGGGGVDGAIHRVAGPELLDECKTLNGCRTGEAKITKGYRLKAKYIIHTVGPIWDASKEEVRKKLLANCYQNSLQLAVENSLKTIAFPNISTGIYGYPKDKAANIAIETVTAFLKNNDHIEKVIFVCFDDENFQLYRNRLEELVG